MPVGNDYYPPFSETEYKRRYRMIKDAMKEKGLDCLLVYGAYSYGGTDPGQVNTVYLSSCPAALNCYVVFPLKDDPTLILSIALHVPNAKDISVIKDVRSSPGREVEIGVGLRLKELGLEKGNIGIVGPTGTWFHFTIPVEHYNHFKQVLPQANFQTVTPWYESLRLVKSEEEIKYMEKAAAMTDLAHEEAFMATRPGIRHSDLRQICEGVAGRLGGKFPFSHIGSTSMLNPQRYYPDFWPTHRTIEAGDVVLTEISLSYGGYCGKLWGTYFVGEPTREYRDLFELAASVHDKAAKELKPGMTGRDIKKYVAPFKKAGYTTAVPLILGWSTYNQPPSAGALEGSPGAALETQADLDFVFKPGHCVNIIAFPLTPDLKKGLWVGTTLVFTKDGIRQLHTYPASKLRVV